MTSWMIPEKAVGGFRLVSGATPLAVNALGNTADLPSYADMFLGLRGGSLGETCILALLIGGIFLIVRGVIKPIIPVAFLGTIAVFALLVGQDPLFHLMAGGAVLGAFFMATDYVTSPVTDMGKLIFGIGCGLITMVIRVYGNYPEGVSFAILLMNVKMCIRDRLQAAVADIEGASVKALKAQYPQGGEKVLIYECTGKIVPEGKLPSDVGCVVMNVSSIAFVAKYMRTGMPLITKRLTVDGDAIAEPKNVEVAIGTSFSDVIDFCGGFKTEPKKIIMGGPMMGFAVPTINYPCLLYTSRCV